MAQRPDANREPKDGFREGLPNAWLLRLRLQAHEATLERRAPESGAIDPLRIGARNEPGPSGGYPVEDRECPQSRFPAALLRNHIDVALPAGKAATMRPDISRPFRELKQEAIDGFEKAYLTELLRAHGGNLARAARAASMDRKNLWALVVRHGLDREQFKKP